MRRSEVTQNGHRIFDERLIKSKGKEQMMYGRRSPRLCQGGIFFIFAQRHALYINAESKLSGWLLDKLKPNQKMCEDNPTSKSYEEYTEQELSEFQKKKEREKKLEIEFSNRCSEIKKKFENGELRGLKSYWHLSKDDIDFCKQPNKIDKELTKEYTIIESVDIGILINSMQDQEDGNPVIYRRKEIFNDELDDNKTCGVIDAWLSEKKLIPPFVSLNEKLNQTHLDDGKHRFNISYSLGEKTIPIIVSDKYIDRVRDLIQKK